MSDNNDTTAMEPDDKNNPFNDADRLIFVGNNGWSEEGVGNDVTPFDFVRDGGRWEAHYEVGNDDNQLSVRAAELKEDIWSDYSDGYCIALNDGRLVGGGRVSSVDYIQYEGEEQDMLSLGVEDSMIHNVAVVPEQ